MKNEFDIKSTSIYAHYLNTKFKLDIIKSEERKLLIQLDYIQEQLEELKKIQRP